LCIPLEELKVLSRIRLAKREREEIDCLLDSAVDMDQVILSEAEQLDQVIGREDDFGRQLGRIRNHAVKNAQLLNLIRDLYRPAKAKTRNL
jgi:hypothetical protein